ncbi:MAG: hypothetical protein HQL49_06880 [Gammaproteobacteria bacterium]|nr:hypothetical protein [Gammaproteobacteria bacterium]
MRVLSVVAVLIWGLMLAGCVSQNERVLQGDEQVKLRNMQSRTFATDDKNLVVRNAIATLQDLGFIIDKADADLGTVSATKLSGYQIRMTVTVRSKSATEMLVRASAQYNLEAIEQPEVYQDFFAVLSKSLFLAANAVE